MVRNVVFAGVISGLVSVGAQAHPGHGPHGAFDGPLHYLNGIEHLAALAVFGLMAAVFWGLRVRRDAQRSRTQSRDRR